MHGAEEVSRADGDVRVWQAAPGPGAVLLLEADDVEANTPLSLTGSETVGYVTPGAGAVNVGLSTRLRGGGSAASARDSTRVGGVVAQGFVDDVADLDFAQAAGLLAGGYGVCHGLVDHRLDLVLGDTRVVLACLVRGDLPDLGLGEASRHVLDGFADDVLDLGLSEATGRLVVGDGVIDELLNLILGEARVLLRLILDDSPDFGVGQGLAGGGRRARRGRGLVLRLGSRSGRSLGGLAKVVESLDDLGGVGIVAQLIER